MLKNFAIILSFTILLMSCGSDDDTDVDTGGNSGDNTPANFDVEITGDFTASYSGSAYYETSSGTITVAMVRFGADWVSTSLTFKAPVAAKTYSDVTGAVTGTLGDNQVAVASSNGDYMFLGESGQAVITSVTANRIQGNFDVNLAFNDADNDFNINVKGTFVAEPD